MVKPTRGSVGTCMGQLSNGDSVSMVVPVKRESLVGDFLCLHH